jgi:hypothetical protein
MRLFRALLLISLVALCGVRLRADTQGFDPTVKINDPPKGPCVSVLTLSFTFMSDGSGGGSLCFTNDSGVAWSTIELDVPAPSPSGLITCGGTAFSGCEKQWFTEGGFATVDFYGLPGLSTSELFTIDLGASGWTPSATFTAFANETDESTEPTPEPGTMALCVTGVAAMLARPRLRHANRFGAKY